MNITQLTFFLLAYAVVYSLVITSGVGATEVEFPTLEIPEIEFIDISAGCAGFTDCTEYLGNVLYNIGAGLIATILFIFNLISFVFQLFVLLITLAVGGIEGAPWYVNLLISTPIIGAISLIVYKLIRSGSSND